MDTIRSGNTSIFLNITNVDHELKNALNDARVHFTVKNKVSNSLGLSQI